MFQTFAATLIRALAIHTNNQHTARAASAKSSNKSRSLLPKLSLLSLAVASLCAPLHAQTLPAVTVTAAPDYLPDAGIATKTDTPAREVPFASSTVGRTLLQDRGVTSMNKAMETVPGVAPINGIGNFNARYRFRGFLASSQLKNGFRQQVNFPVTEFQNVETLEVMRGPASGLYGRFDPGGVLNIVTKRPGVDIREVGLSLGDDGQRRAIADFGGKLGESLAYRLNAVVENSDTYRDYVGNRTTFLAPSFQFKLAPQTNLVVDAEILKRDSNFDRGFPLALNVPILNLPPQRFLGDPTDTYKNDTTNISAMLSHTLAGGTKLRAGFARNSAQSEGAYFIPNPTSPINNAGVLSRRNQLTTDVNRDSVHMAEATGQAMWSGVQHKWLAGLERSTSLDDSRINRSTVNSNINIYNPVYGAVKSPTTAAINNSEATNQTTALYLQDEISFNKHWRLTVGARSESITSRNTNRITNITRQSSVRATTLRTGLAWMPTSDTTVFGNYSESFSPEVAVRPIVGGADPIPSRGKQVELGVRQEFMDKRVQTSATVFDITRTNARVPDTILTTQDRQVGEQRSRGIELEVSGRPTARWQVVASTTTLDAQNTRDTATLTGKRFNGAPRAGAALWNRYDFSPALGLGAGLVYAGERFVDPANTLVLPSYTRWDLAAYGQVTQGVRWQVNLLNALNAGYFESGNTVNNLYPGQPRTLRASVNVKF